MSEYEKELHEAIELVEMYAGYGVADERLLARVRKAAAHLKREVLQTARWVQRIFVLERRLGAIRAITHGDELPPDLDPLALEEVLHTFTVEKCPGGDFTVVVVDVAGNRVSLERVLRVNEIQAHWVRERFAEAYKLSVEAEL